MSKTVLLLSLFVAIFAVVTRMTAKGPADPYQLQPLPPPTDTIPPIQDRYTVDPANTRSNPFDIDDPAAIDKSIEYDPATDRYIIRETIGENTYFRPPTYLSFDEYRELRQKQDEQNYFNELAGITRGGSLSIDDPLSVVNVEESLIDRLFGGNTVSIEPQGGVDLTFGIDHQRLENPILTERQRSTTIFDFDMDIQMNVVGSIGEKLKLNTNFNTGATFNFDNQIKLDYNSDLFSEDDIIKKIEAGNVSLPLRGTLIQGAQSLFGLKTELQFGHLRLTAIASQQQSERENITVQGGSQLQEFEVRADEYDENRHFFLSHYNRNTYEGALSNLPQISTLFHLESIEVWITNDRNEVTDVRDIVAFADLAEPERLTNPNSINRFQEPRYREICDGRPLPENGANDLYGRLIGRGEAIREIDRTVAILQSAQFNLQQSRDFEKVSARKLSAREYTVHPELGFVSLNINVQPDQVVGVSYRYKYNGEIFRVGELSTVTDDVSSDTTNLSNRVLFVKMLKSTTQRVGQPTWDLMMKNVYSLGAYQVNPEDFKLDVLYEDPGEGFKRFLPTSNLAGVPLIRVFGLDRLNTQGDPNPDGIFDFVPGLTINPQNGRVYFPKLEPFGSDLADQLETEQARNRYVYQELYDSTLFRAQEFPEKNRFIIQGNYKSSISSEISLGAFNIPPGSVRVTAGGALLIEGRDYEVDYSTGRVRILNDAILSSGVPVNVNFEDNTVFALQQKTMLGLRADYALSDDINIGATFMQLFERPFTPKVNIGEDPINNKIYGMDLTLTKEAPFLTRLVDKLPLYSTSQPSSISLTAEAAYLKPGHSRAINQGRKRDGEAGGIVYVDDFEGSAAPLDVSQPVNRWFLASVPRNDAQNSNPFFPEATAGGLVPGANRAALNWYRIDPSARQGNDSEDVYVSTVPQQEVFPNRTIQPSQQQAFLFQTFDLSYDPTIRGPYNFDLPDGGYPGLTAGVQLEATDELAPVKLNAPETRWGGIMRALTTNDFQTANIEFMEFWMLSPFLDPLNAQAAAQDADLKQGKLYINLGNVSEDILPDSRRFFENGLPGPSNPNRPTDETVWGRIPVGQQITRAFDNDLETRARQDVGLDGLDDAGERNKYADWFNEISGANPVAAQIVAEDPANDNFRYYNSNVYGEEQGVRVRYRNFNNTQGNSQQPEGNSNIRTAGTNIPDAEDLDQDNTLNESESYFQYEIPLQLDPANPRRLAPNTPFITDQIEAPNGRIWYRFRIPVNTPLKKSVGGIQDFRSIRFMRMYMRGFEAPVILRFAKFELVRNQWRRFTRDFLNADTPPVISGSEDTDFNIDAVNIEENSRRFPVAYTLPRGIAREQNLGIINTLQNEQSLALRVDNLYPGDRRAVFKYTNTDMRLYERLKMFVHAEPRDRDNPMAAPEDGELSLFLRLGSDFESNYYEYEIPLTMTDLEVLAGISNTNSNAYKDEVWLAGNELDFPLQVLKNLKLERNDLDISPGQEYGRVYVPENRNDTEHIIRVKGNPNLGYVKVMMIGLKNRNDLNTDAVSAEVWVNELRLEGLDERGGTAALARMDMQLADLGNLTVAGNFNSIGFGALDNKLLERSRERTLSYDVAANLNLDKFLPEEWGLRIPFYAQHSNITSTPEFDPYDLDLKLQEKVARADDQAERDSLREQAQEQTKITSFNFTNVRKERTNPGGGPAKPWDISNFSASYSYTDTEISDPFIELESTQEYTGAIDYTYVRQTNYIEPFKGLESKYLRLLKEFNFNPLPNSFSFTTVMDRTFATTSYRFAGVDDRFNTFYNQRFLWNRNYDVQWDLTKSLKIGFNAQHFATIDEPNGAQLALDPEVTDVRGTIREVIWEELEDFGRPKLYQHGVNASYTLPLRYLPFMEWVQVRAQYQGGYTWTAAALNTDSLGNVIQNSQNRQVSADLNFERFYDQFGFLQEINRRQRAPARGQPARPGAPQAPERGGRRESEIAPLTKALVRPLLFLRRARLTYSEQLATIVPGYMPTTNLMGQSPGFQSPGWDFVAGIQPKVGPEYWNTDQDWLNNNKEWISDNVFLNQDVIQNKSTTWDGQLTLEPVPDFRIDLTWNRNRRDDYTETFKVLDVAKGPNGEPIPGAAGFEHAVPTFGGALTTTYGALRLPFTTDTSQLLALFQDFENYRRIISQRLGDGTLHQDPNLAQRGYADGYGPNQQDVLLPAFIAAYTGQDPNDVSLDIFDQATRPNWRATYNGLSRLPGMRDIFSNFSISHGYQATLAINNYRTSLDYLATLQELPPGTVLAFDTVSLNYFPRIEIPDVVIQEAFAPVIALEMTLLNGMSFNFDYKQARTRAANVTSKLLSETVSKEFVGGFGYVLNGVNIGFLTGDRGGRGGRNEEETAPPPGGNRPPNSRSGGRLNVQDMDIQFNFSLRDDVTFARKLEQGISEPTRGTYTLSFSPSAEYQLNQQLALRLFFDYRRSIPRNTLGYPQTTANGGVVVRFLLN